MFPAIITSTLYLHSFYSRSPFFATQRLLSHVKSD